MAIEETDKEFSEKSSLSQPGLFFLRVANDFESRPFSFLNVVPCHCRFEACRAE